MIAVGLLQKAKFLINDHSTTILTAAGVTGTLATAYLTGRATFKAARIIEENQILFDSQEVNGSAIAVPSKEIRELTSTAKVKLIWHLYIPPVGIGALTITSIIMANKVSSKQIAALTVASGISERAFKEYKEKVVEKLGDRQDRDIRDEIAQDRVTNTPVNLREVMVIGAGEVLCFDMSSGRYFQSTVEDIKRAENRVNHELINFMSASLTLFYDEIGLTPTTHSDSVGWNMNNKLDVVLSTTLSPDNRPCIAVDFRQQPSSDYIKQAWG